ncbi:hypothetical protein CAPTEDRAFT_185420 [Capitella teleta]|uniref:Uncharacterized protein n=1 Tax=Capitella teleta TaxID=283909 RepID=R7UNK5_CAPTE|nr:hypothetical protein CAPTEDRAFT_185420 [Capitella teleta]|eukprot:ELU08094.1 hypothetical protein CAPTEDRAFT_185420 [Capitella teleta]
MRRASHHLLFHKTHTSLPATEGRKEHGHLDKQCSYLGNSSIPKHSVVRWGWGDSMSGHDRCFTIRERWEHNAFAILCSGNHNAVNLANHGHEIDGITRKERG